MSHPSREEWMAFFYEDLPKSEAKRLGEHLKICPVCEKQAQNWRGAMRALDQWKLAQPGSRRPAQPWLRWAVAASLLLAAGISIGAAVRPRIDLTAIRAAIAPQIQASVEHELKAGFQARIEKALADSEQTRAAMAELAKSVSENRAHDHEALVVTLRELEARRMSDLQALRKDLETVAALTEESLRSAQSQLVRLAGYTGSGNE